ncbi:MAG: hypothetical protein EBR82_80875 [Caulobacteraceae bacterium]|nr:hypothetical protein [Caulobacteraceae bacterium]
MMDVALWTGNGGTQTISGLGFSPDFVWLKKRSGAADHYLYDQVRGATYRLYSNTTDAESTSATGLNAFTSDGFTLGSAIDVNQSSNTYVAWTWDAGSSTVTNTQGSITSTVRANATAGFSVVTYTGNLTSGATVGHGLGVAPSLILVKCRSNAAGWLVYHGSLGATKYLALEGTAAAATYSGAWSDTSPSSTVFSVGYNSSVNFTRTYVAYCFAPVVGYSSFGSYTGNGSSDGPFVYTGFRPKFVLVKNITTAGTFWGIMDSARDPYNAGGRLLYPNSSIAEEDYTTSYPDDFLSNGFKPRNAGTVFNSSGSTYIYAAFAESPFNYARAR